MERPYTQTTLGTKQGLHKSMIFVKRSFFSYNMARTS